MRRRFRSFAGCLLGACGLAQAGCFAVRPGYADTATGRTYAGFAKPAFYPADLLAYRDCDGCRPPYEPPVAAFSSWGCVTHAGGCRPPLATTEVYAPPIARYEQYPGNPGFTPPPPERDRPRRGGEAAPPAPAPLPAPMPVPLAGSTDEPFGIPEVVEDRFDIDADAAAPGLPSLEVEPDGVGVE